MADSQHKYVSLDKLSHFLLKIKEVIPKKTSDLTNDSNYVSDANYVHTDNNYSTTDKDKLDGLENYTLPNASDSTLGGIKVGSGLSIDSDGKLSATVSNLDWANIDNKPTTVSGYGITDVYTKTEVDTKISSTFKFMGSKNSYEDLPSEGNNSGDVWQVDDKEYAWNGNDWVLLGFNMDLSNYWSKDELVEATNEEIDGLFS